LFKGGASKSSKIKKSKNIENKKETLPTDFTAIFTKYYNNVVSWFKNNLLKKKKYGSNTKKTSINDHVEKVYDSGNSNHRIQKV
jgi:hypothetical protein